MPGMRRMLVLFIIGSFFTPRLRAQDTLPGFSVTVRGTGKILVSWRNNYPVVTQISIQRSIDSLKNFTTLITVPDPRLPENGVVDNKAPHPNFYYRLFVVLESGKYLFSRSQRPHADLAEKPAAAKSNSSEDITDDAEVDDNAVLARTDRQRVRFADETKKDRPGVSSPARIRELPKVEIGKPVYIKKGDTLVGQLSGQEMRSFRDSILTRTKDTLIFIDGDTMQVRTFVPKEVYKPSIYVFTGKYGNVNLSLPDAASKHYSVKFFDENDKLLFELTAIKDPSLILDKVNFLHAGWYRFELYESDKLKEKNKLLIPKDF